LSKKQSGRPSGIVGDTHPAHLPCFDECSDLILIRAKEMGSSAIRLSLDPARLCPGEGQFDERVMAHYIQILAKCRRLGMEPLVTLNHWTLPKSLAFYDPNGAIKHGPLEHPRIVDYFAWYLERVAESLFDPERIRNALPEEERNSDFAQQICEEGVLCRWFVSLNEPSNMIFVPYVLGRFPPYHVARFIASRRLVQKLRSMHAMAYDCLHSKAASLKPGREEAQPKVGIAHNVTSSYFPLFERLANWGLVDRLEEGQSSDFIGLQYYFHSKLTWTLDWPFWSIRSSDPRYWSDHPDFGQVYPAGLGSVLRTAARKYPDKQLLITEFGFADRTDEKRPEWILDSVSHLVAAKNEGVRLDGTLLWTLTDNFEWHRGMDIRFGLFDKDGNRLPSDTDSPDHVSSREVWTACTQHLLNPTEKTAAGLSALRKRTAEQLERSVRNG